MFTFMVFKTPIKYTIKIGCHKWVTDSSMQDGEPHKVFFLKLLLSDILLQQQQKWLLLLQKKKIVTRTWGHFCGKTDSVHLKFLELFHLRNTEEIWTLS